MTATATRNESPVKAIKKQTLPCRSPTVKHQCFSRKLPMALRTSISYLNTTDSKQNTPPLVSNKDFSSGTGSSMIQRNTTSILESLRRRYVHRGLKQTNVSSSCTEQVSHLTSSMVTTTPAVVTPRPSAKSSFCQLPAFETDDSALTSPLRIKSARRTVTPLKFDNSMLDADDTSDESDVSDDDEEDDTLSLNSNFSYVSDNKETRQSQSKRPSIRFHSYVKVVEIPNRNTYTDKQKRRMWNGSSAIRKNAKRNRIEYEYEGSAWHSVVEEDKFRLINGRMIHPVHIPLLV